MTDDLWNESLIIQQMKAVSWAEGWLEGIIKSKTEAKRDLMISTLQERFPLLADLVQQKVAQITDMENLYVLCIQVFNAPDEASARALLAVD